MKWQIPYQGTTYEFDDGRLTASEARLQKRLTDGALPADCDEARSKLDGDAWLAALVIAMRRAGGTLDQAGIDEDALVLSDIVPATHAAMSDELARARAQVAAAEVPDDVPDDAPDEAPADPPAAAKPARKPRRKPPAEEPPAEPEPAAS